MSPPANDSRKVVWVLGAGFSAGIGGPLLARLLSSESILDVALRFPSQHYPGLYGAVANTVRPLYWAGLSDDSLVPRTHHADERLWANAEEFLDYLDAAVESGEANPLRSRLDALSLHIHDRAGSVPEWRDAARRIVAAECSAFLEGAATTGERWDPYRTWASSLLTKQDALVTFNYDLVLETLDLLPTHIEPTLPRAPVGRSDDLMVLKLHGSVDWQAKEGTVTRSEDRHFALKPENASEIVIATPGPSKKSTVLKHLKPLWSLAARALQTADAIVFIGYRFPETDAYARHRILEAIRGNKGPDGKRHTLSIHIILGSSAESSRHANRLASMLRFACTASGRGHATREKPSWNINMSDNGKFFAIEEHPLLAQDFFSAAAERSDLFLPV